MNILPKKRWHVRTRENIARVRRDEAQAAEEQKEIERRKKLAEREARLRFMRNRSANQFDRIEERGEEISNVSCAESLTNSVVPEHVNFFKELEDETFVSKETNAEHEKEKKEETEKYEKQIGYLTYLGQDTNEATGNVSWYNKIPDAAVPLLDDEEEKDLKNKLRSDPINGFKHLLWKPSSKKSAVKTDVKLYHELESLKSPKRMKEKGGGRSSEEKYSKKEEKRRKKDAKRHKREKREEKMRVKEERKNEILKILREKRLKREAEERKRAEKLLAEIRGEPIIESDLPAPQITQKYNSQFNPHLAKQNIY